MLEKLKYPIGKWEAPTNYSEEIINAWISDIEAAPKSIEALVLALDESQLNWKYRPGGWNIRQVVHHMSDSHMNAYIRHKLTMTEDCPTIIPYNEKLWADMLDVQKVSIKEGCQLLRLIHQRWTIYLNSLPFESLSKSYFHPAKKRKINMYESIGMYSWHSRHHLAHIENAIKFAVS
jgi:hypothetical protein